MYVVSSSSHIDQLLVIKLVCGSYLCSALIGAIWKETLLLPVLLNQALMEMNSCELDLSKIGEIIIDVTAT